MQKFRYAAIRRALLKRLGDTGEGAAIDAFLASALSSKHPVSLTRVNAVLSRVLEQNGFLLGGETLAEAFADAQNGANPFSYAELDAAADCCVLLIAEKLYEAGAALPASLLSACMTTLNALASFDYDAFLAAVSKPEKVFLSDAPVAFGNADAGTRRLYREACSRKAKKTGISEREAAAGLCLSGDIYPAHPIAAALYFPLIALLTSASFAALCFVKGGVPIALLCLLPLTEFFKRALDFLYPRFIPAVQTARLRADCIPDDARTLVVITSLLFGKERDGELFDRLERYYLANSDCRFATFGILGDLRDSGSEICDGDEMVVAYARERVAALNEKYGCRFCLFIRKRVFSESEQKFMGRERKRGAVGELIRLISGEDAGFAVADIRAETLFAVKFVITLDADTELGLSSVADLTGSMLHPVNRPKIKNGIVTGGYGVMQPRMDTSPESAFATRFSALISGGGGVDRYASASFDLYQAVFGEGIFCGKGIIDVGAFSSLPHGLFDGESVLSHDALEGGYLRCTLLSDISLVDSCPKNALSYYKRLHRWIRGDVQALFHAKKPLSTLSRIKLWDNLRRALVPVFAVLTVTTASFSARPWLFVLSASAYLLLPVLLSLIFTARSSAHRFFSGLLPHLWQSAASALFEISSLLHSAFLCCDALSRSLYRVCVSRRKMLEWVTASESDRIRDGGLYSYLYAMLPSTATAALLTFILPSPSQKLLTAAWTLFPFVCLALSKPFSTEKSDERIAAQVKLWAADMWRFFADNVTAADNWLPPDNLQISPSETLAHRTSPTNIGLYMLSCLSARDFGFIDSEELCLRLDSALDTLDSLPLWHGHLYNWYDTISLEVIGASFVSTVDSGNFASALSALSAGLSDYSDELPRLNDTASRLRAFSEGCDFSRLYNPERRLLSVGFDCVSDSLSASCYDLFCSEAQLTYYFAACRHMLPDSRESWRKLRRPSVLYFGRTGVASWTGTMFEYFMPALLLPVKRGTASYEALMTALFVQRNGRRCGMWGRSESGYYAFDADMNYQYKAFGCPSLAVKRPVARENVIAPYSAFLTLPFMPAESAFNLRRMENFGIYGKYGFYEAVDFTPARVGHGYAFIRSFMSHHIGMSLTAAANLCFGNIMIDRFMSDPVNRCAQGLLAERVCRDAHALRRPRVKSDPARRPLRYELEKAGAEYDPSSPLTAVVSNNKSRIIASSSGDICLYEGRLALTSDVFDRTDTKKSLQLYFRADDGLYQVTGQTFSSGGSYISYSRHENDISASAVLTLHGSMSCFCIRFEAEGGFSELAPLLYFEPVMAKPEDYNAHPAFYDLSVTAEYDENAKLLFFRRRPRSERDRDCWLAVTMLSGSPDMEFSTRRDALLGLNYTADDIRALAGRALPRDTGACVIPACAVGKSSVTRGGRYRCEFLISFANSRADAAKIIALACAERGHPGVSEAFIRSLNPVCAARNAAAYGGEAAYRYESLLLSCIYYDLSPELPETLPPRDYIWSFGISGDLPVFTLAPDDSCFTPEGPTASCLRILTGFIGAHRSLSMSGIRLELVICARDADRYGSPRARSLEELVNRLGCSMLFNRKGGIYVVDADANALALYSRLTVRLDSSSSFAALYEGVMSSRERVVSLAQPLTVLAKPYNIPPSESFKLDGANVEIYKGSQRVPWSYIYSNSCFGTLVTQNSLGFSWFRNSREGRLTPWNNDILLGCRGERLIATVGGSEYDLCACANKVVYSAGRAEWSGYAGNVGFTVCAGVDRRLPVKLISCRLSLPCSLRLEIIADKKAPVPPFVREIAEGCYVIGADISDKTREYIFNRFCCAEDIEIALDETAAETRELTNSGITLESGCAALDAMLDRRLIHQSLRCRMNARTGFYQSGGAYGFRDQLQDCLSVMYSSPSTVRSHIIRCAAHQYEEGDVMHWWHWNSPSSGVRTRCSDDYIWLPYVTAAYVALTGDNGLLEVNVPYLYSEPLSPSENERYETPERSNLRESVYTRCKRALDRAISLTGAHGLPLMGSCDWNDGMNRVGAGGGESVWLAFFIRLTIDAFSPLLEEREDSAMLSRCREAGEQLRSAVEKYAWDGDHYIRAFFGDGSPLGSESCNECRIDALPQAFAAVTDGRTARALTAIDRARDELFDRRNGLCLLFTPPFDRPLKDPGYIKGYAPGLRENGGQYTHAAVWTAWGLLRAGDSGSAFSVLRAINPLYRYSEPRFSSVYLAEPYALAADIYSAEGHTGRGGWSLYTGAAAWYYKIALEELIGYRETPDGFTLYPALSGEFPSFTLRIERHDTVYTVNCAFGDRDSFALDGKIVNNVFIFDKKRHFLEITVEKKDDMV